MNCRTSLFVVLAAALFFCCGIYARDMESIKKSIPADPEVKKVSLITDIGAARLTISTHDGGDLFTADVRYDADRVEIDIEYEKHKAQADIRVLSEKLSRRLQIDSDDCRWELSLSRDYLWTVDIEIGFTDGEMDFSGLPLEEFRMDIGASECRVIFDRPNPERLRKMKIDAGAGELEITGLGYSNFEHLIFDAGAGEFLLNFDGLERGFHTAEIELGVGELKIQLPKGLPVRVVENDGWLSSFRIKGSHLEKVGDGIYETEGFDRADYGLEIELDIGIGEATIGRADGTGTILTAGSKPGTFYGDYRGAQGFFLPAVPGMPEFPELPELPELPEIPAMMILPEFPELPESPEFPDPKGRRIRE